MTHQVEIFNERNYDYALRKAIEKIDLARLSDALACGADPNASIEGGRFNYTPLVMASARAAKYEHSAQALGIIEVLLKAGANPRQAPRNGDTPLHKAAAAGWVQAVEVLLQAGADPHARNQEGLTALHAAMMLRSDHTLNEKVIHTLLAAGANIEAKSSLGITPLHCACAFGHLPAIEALLKAGADPTISIVGTIDAKYILIQNEFGINAECKASALSAIKEALKHSATSASASNSSTVGKKKTIPIVMQWFRDKRFGDQSLPKGQHYDSKPVIRPGGQKEATFDPLDILPVDPESALAQHLIASLNLPKTWDSNDTAITHIQMEPGFVGFALPWFSSHYESLGLCELTHHTLHHSIILPLRGMDAHEQPISFLVTAEMRELVKSNDSLPTRIHFNQRNVSGITWRLGPDFESMTFNREEERLKMLMSEAQVAWDFETFFNPSKFDKKALEECTPHASNLSTKTASI